MNHDDPTIVIAATPRQWASSLHAQAVDHGGVVVRATVLTAADARSEPCDVLVVDDITSFLTPALVAAVHEAGRAVLGVFDPDDPHGKGGLVEMGVDGLISADSDPTDLVATIRGLAADGPVTSAASQSLRGGASRATEPATTSRLIGVTGPPGGVGVTEVALELAMVLASAGQPTVLVDADELAPGLAQRIGLALHPNLLGAVDACRRGGDLEAGLHRVLRRKPLFAVPGMSSGGDWPAVPDGGLADVADGLGELLPHVVVDLGHCPDAATGPTGLRYGHAAELARRCTDLVVVAAPTPKAVARALASCARLPQPGQRLHPVLNRTGGDRFARDEALAELARALGGGRVHVVAEDARVARAAWRGTRVGRGKFSRGVAGLAAAVVGRR